VPRNLGRLFHAFLVDLGACIEYAHLQWMRIEMFKGFADVVAADDSELGRVSLDHRDGIAVIHVQCVYTKRVIYI
jgi:hypothetical protein